MAASEVAAAYIALRASSAELGGDFAKARSFALDAADKGGFGV